MFQNLLHEWLSSNPKGFEKDEIVMIEVKALQTFADWLDTRNLTTDAPVHSGAEDDLPYKVPICICGHVLNLHRKMFSKGAKDQFAGDCLEKSCDCFSFRPRNGR